MIRKGSGQARDRRDRKTDGTAHRGDAEVLPGFSHEQTRDWLGWDFVKAKDPQKMYDWQPDRALGTAQKEKVGFRGVSSG
jgi:hypothetical protein